MTAQMRNATPISEHDVGGRRLAVAVTSLAAVGDDDGVHQLLAPLESDQLRALVLMLATNQVASPQQHRPHVTSVDVDVSSPAAVCDLAVTQAAHLFGTTTEAILSADRHRTVTDARAVAMTAVRHSGLTLTAIADQFDRDHTSVIHAVRRTEDNPRLLSAATSIGTQIAARYDQDATELVSDEPTPVAPDGRAADAQSAGTTEERRRPQLTALPQRRQAVSR